MAYSNRVKSIIDKLNSNFLERDEVIRLCLLSFFANKSIFLYGATGTAKNMLARNILRAFKDNHFFSYSINYFSPFEEIFGPINIKTLKENKSKSYLPEANFVFLDEIWQSSPAVLNKLLTIINEKTYKEGNGEVKVPLLGFICASNEFPAPNQHLDALYDRMLIRYKVVPIKQKENFENLLQNEFNIPNQLLDEAFSLEELQNILVKSQKVKFSTEALDFMYKLKTQIEYYNQNIEHKKDCIYISDRRYKQISELLKVCVYLNDRKKISIYDLAILKHCLWSNEKDQKVLDSILQEIFKQSIDDALIKAKNNLKNFENTINKDYYTKTGKLKRLKANIKNDFLNKLYDFTKIFNELKQKFHKNYQNLMSKNNNIFLIEDSYTMFFNAYNKIFEDIDQQLIKIQQFEQDFKNQKAYTYVPKTKKELKDLVNDFSINLAKIDVSNVSDFSSLFEESKRKDFSGLEHWDVSHVTDMSNMFKGAKYFNYPIENWNVSNVTDMSYMFCWATLFNQALNNWNVSNVTNMNNMFWGAKSFNQPLDKWDVSRVTNMGFMFWDAESFNQPLDKWDVSHVISMDCMFSDASSFNQPLNNWNVSRVKRMGGMFLRASSFNQALDKWNVSHVDDMSNMFKGATSFNQPLNNWNVSRVTSMSCMFWDAESFNQPLDKWDVSHVIGMSYMFCNASSFNQPLDNWNVSRVTRMNCMFWGAESFNQSLDKWDTSSVISTNYMFSGSAIDPLPTWYKVKDEWTL